LTYNIPMIQSLRILETAAGFALLLAPEKAHEFLEPLGVKIPTAQEMRGLRGILS